MATPAQGQLCDSLETRGGSLDTALGWRELSGESPSVWVGTDTPFSPCGGTTSRTSPFWLRGQNSGHQQFWGGAVMKIMIVADIIKQLTVSGTFLRSAMF